MSSPEGTRPQNEDGVPGETMSAEWLAMIEEAMMVLHSSTSSYACVLTNYIGGAWHRSR